MSEGYSMSDEVVPTKCLNWDYITDTSFFKCLTACQKLYVLLWKQTICSGIFQEYVRDFSGECNLGKVFEFRKVGCVFKGDGNKNKKPITEIEGNVVL